MDGFMAMIHKGTATFVLPTLLLKQFKLNSFMLTSDI